MAFLHKTNSRILTIITSVSLVFFVVVALNITPLIRGPSPYPPEWQYAYFFINTVNRIWFPVISGIILLLFVAYTEGKTSNFIEKNEKTMILLIILLNFLFQISVLYFSRGGITVILQRIIDPNMSDYFTQSTKINNIYQFLSNYNNTVLEFTGHARGHPPGGIILFWLINKIFSLLPFITEKIQLLTVSRNDINILWLSLKSFEKAGALFSGIMIPFLSGITVMPIYKLGKLLYGSRTGLRSSLLYIITPSLVLFIPMYDALFPVFSTFSVYFLIKGLKSYSFKYLFLSGLILSLGLFFSMSLIPILSMIIIFSILGKKITELKITLDTIIIFFLGLIVFPIVLYLIFNYSYIEVSKTIMTGLAPRSYLLWLIYNPYDHFIFIGIPLFILLIFFIKNNLVNFSLKNKTISNVLLISYLITFFMLNISGLCRAETGRIWLFFVPFSVIFISSYITLYNKFSRTALITILTLQILQIMVMQEFWVTIW